MGATNLVKSPHHKSTSALSDVQTTNPSVSVPGQRTSTSSAPFGVHSHASSAAPGGRAHTLAVTESSSYLSSIASGGYADEFDDVSPPSSGISSANTSFASNYSGSLYNALGHGYSAGGGGKAFDLADDFSPHLNTGGSGGSHSNPPASYGGSNSLHTRGDTSVGSHAPHFRRTSSPNAAAAFPADSHQQMFVAHGDRSIPRQGHASRAQDIKRSHSPDVLNRSISYSSSYNPPSMEHANFNQHHRAHQHGQHSSASHQQQNIHGDNPATPGMFVHGHMTSSGGREQQSRCNVTGGSGSPHVARTTPPSAQSRDAASCHSSAPGGVDSVPYRIQRQPSEQIGLLEALTMVNKSAESKFDDGTLV